MATFADMFNQAGQKLEQGFNSPWTQLGMQMLAQGGWQPGDPGFGQRFGQAGLGFMQQRAGAAQAQQTQLKNQMEMVKAQQEMMEAQARNQTREALRQRAESDPTFLADQPLARNVILAGGSPQDLKGMGALNSGPKVPTQPFQYETRGPSGEQTQMTWDPATNSYKAGATYIPTDVLNARTGQTNAEIAQRRLEREQEQRNRQFTLEEEKAAVARKKAEREQQAATLKSTMDRKTLETGYKGAVTQIDETIKLIEELETSKGFDNLFGFRGQIPITVPSSDTAAAQTRLERLKGGLGLKELARLAEMDIVLTPVSNTDLAKVEQSAAALGSLQSAKDARTEMSRIKSVLTKAKEEAASRYGEYNQLYDLQTPAQDAPSGAPAVGTVMDGYRYNGGDPANPASWSKQ